MKFVESFSGLIREEFETVSKPPFPLTAVVKPHKTGLPLQGVFKWKQGFWMSSNLLCAQKET